MSPLKIATRSSTRSPISLSTTASYRCEPATLYPQRMAGAPSEQQRSTTFVLSGPGGVGKGTVVERLLEVMPNLWLSRSWTTRDRRPGEAVDAYNFVDQATFKAHIENDGFLEWVEFLDYLQGTPVPDPPDGNDVLLEIDVQGAAQIKAMDPDAVLVFLDAPTVEEQEARLRSRGDSEDRVAQRLATAVEERQAAKELGCIVVINDDLDSTVTELVGVIDANR